MMLEFFPNGRESTHLEGFCSVFLWCPAGVKIKYQLRVGSHWTAPDEDTYASKMGHGHSNLCHLRNEIDAASGSVTIGLQIHHLRHATDYTDGVKVISESPEYMINKE